jgi:hypothetical protein
MPRDLSPKDQEILVKLAPECADLVCNGSGELFHSVLPPVANHFAEDPDDFADRIARLSTEELSYLVGLIEEGSESLGCIDPAFADRLFSDIAARLGRERANAVLRVYAAGDSCN